MPWSTDNYPDSMKNLDPAVRNKAIEIANALLRDRYSEGRAIAIATAKAHEVVNGNPGDRPQYEVKARDDEWIFQKKDSSRVIFKDRTKAELLEQAKPYTNEHNGILAIYKEDGSLEDTLYE